MLSINCYLFIILTLFVCIRWNTRSTSTRWLLGTTRPIPGTKKWIKFNGRISGNNIRFIIPFVSSVLLLEEKVRHVLLCDVVPCCCLSSWHSRMYLSTNMSHMKNTNFSLSISFSPPPLCLSIYFFFSPIYLSRCCEACLGRSHGWHHSWQETRGISLVGSRIRQRSLQRYPAHISNPVLSMVTFKQKN